jgi:spermidine synthase
LLRFASLASFLSAFSALVYQSLWLRSFGLAFGGTTACVSVTLAVFMAGLALGNLWVGRLAPGHPFKRYAMAEAGMGLSAVLAQVLLSRLPQVLSVLSPTLNFSIPMDWMLKAGLATVIVFPCAICCGLTLPLLTDWLEQAGENEHSSFGKLYIFSTLGAASGAAATAFVLIPSVGVMGAAMLAAAVNGFLALLATRQSRATLAITPAPMLATQKSQSPARFAVVAGISGAVAFILEVLWTRSLSLVLGSSAYAFAMMLASMLLGTALGAGIYLARRDRLPRPAPTLALGYAALALLIPLNAGILGQLPDAYFSFLRHVPPSFAAYESFGFFLALLALLPVSALQGFLFPLLLRLSRGEGARQDSASLYLCNTLGAVLGALGAGFFLIPSFGLQPNYSIVAGLAAVMAALCWPKPLPLKMLALSLAVLGGLLSALFLRPWDRLLVTSGVFQSDITRLALQLPNSRSYSDLLSRESMLAYYKEGAEAVVAVRHKPSSGESSLVINGKVDASLLNDVTTQTLLAQIPLCLHPGAQSALIIGWGSGCTVGSAAAHPLASIDCVEIEPAVFETAPLFKAINSRPGPEGSASYSPVWNDPRFKIRFADARQDLCGRGQKYDVIISEPSNPWISGVSNLFTLDFYTLARKRLNPHGIFCQWFHFYALSPEDLRRQLRTFAQAFSKTSLWVVPQKDGDLSLSGDLILLGSEQEPDLNAPEFIRRFVRPEVVEDLKKIKGADPATAQQKPLAKDLWWFYSLRLLGDEDLRHFAGQGPLNTDNDPLLEFSAPKSLYRPQSASTASSSQIFRSLESASRELLPPIKSLPRLQLLARLGSHYRRHNLYLKAIPCLAEAEAGGVSNLQLSLDLGLAYFFENRPLEAEPRLRRAFLAQPEDYARFQMGGVKYLNSGQPDMALRIFEMALSIKPNDAECHYARAVGLDRLGRRAEALAALETALRLRPGFEMAKKMLEAVLRKP